MDFGCRLGFAWKSWEFDVRDSGFNQNQSLVEYQGKPLKDKHLLRYPYLNIIADCGSNTSQSSNFAFENTDTSRTCSMSQDPGLDWKLVLVKI